MKTKITFLLFFVYTVTWGQVEKDSTWNQFDFANYMFANLNTQIPTNFLFNRLLLEDTIYSVVWNTSEFDKDTSLCASADQSYAMLYELKLMALDSAVIPERMTVYDSVANYLGAIEFDWEEYHYPIGIFDYIYNELDVQTNLTHGNINVVDSAYYLQGNNLLLNDRKAAIIAPLYDLFDSEIMALIFKRENFFSNHRSVDEIVSIKVTFNGNSQYLDFEQPYYFKPNQAVKQLFYAEIMYYDSTLIKNFFQINTPELLEKGAEGRAYFQGCSREGVINQNGNKLKWCLVERCGYDGRIYKPYIVITGYRPPIFGQSYKTTWKYYNNEHGSLLNSLIDNNYDIFLVKFNISARPNKHGMAESAGLFEEFIQFVNIEKGGMTSGQENIIHGSSMGADIARLTLLRMEKKHFENTTYSHHHSRLNIAYDGNFYGANIPLSYQAQIFSAFKHPSNNVAFDIVKTFLSNFLFATMNQKTVMELLTYHIKAIDEQIFSYPNENHSYAVPTHHWRRQGYYDQLELVDNHVHVFPMPIYTRNIAISLGHINIANNYTTDGFNSPGEYWKNINLGLWQFKIGTAKYMSPGQTFQLFKRKKIGIPPINHELNVSQMREIDNASGSYLKGMGNIISVANWAYFTIPNLFDGKDFFSHKSVLTALGINKSLWPANGNMTMDMKGWGLMFTNRNHLIPNQDESNYKGYPNLGRPTDHFSVTPFEAIFVDTLIQPHIRLNNTPSYIVDSLNNFILNEVEPWYLGLQNQHLGAQARSDYRYYAFRRAKYHVLVGHLVTPTTDPGDYEVEANGKLALSSGGEVNLKPGVHFKPGSDIHIFIEYDNCSNKVREEGDDIYTDHISEVKKEDNQQQSTLQPNKAEKIRLFPNPNGGSFTLQLPENIPSGNISISDISGKVVYRGEVREKQTIIQLNLDRGIYYLHFSNQTKVQTIQFLVQ